MARTYISVEIERRVRAAAHNRCGYCLSPQHLVMARLEIEHISPLRNDEPHIQLAQMINKIVRDLGKSFLPDFWLS